MSRARDQEGVRRAYLMFERILADFSTAQIAQFDHAAAGVFESLRANKVRVGTMDLRIAAIAISQNMTLPNRQKCRILHEIAIESAMGNMRTIDNAPIAIHHASDCKLLRFRILAAHRFGDSGSGIAGLYSSPKDSAKDLWSVCLIISKRRPFTAPKYPFLSPVSCRFLVTSQP